VPLTDVEIRQAIRSPTLLKLFDGGGLYLLVEPPRKPGWRLKYRIRGVEKSLSLGLYSEVPLKRARDKRDAVRRQLADGLDPSAERKAAKVAQSDTFKTIADEWLALQAKTLAVNTIEINRGRLAAQLYPAFGNKPIRSITAPDLLAVLRRVEAAGNSESAHRLRSLYGRVARFGIATGRSERDISADLKGALAPVVVEHFAAITDPRRIGELLRAIDSYIGQPSTAFALKLAPLVFVRPGELRAAEWQEFDLDAAEWRIPEARMKMRLEHVVPLAKQAVALLHELHALTGDGKLLFPGLRTPSRPISENTLNAALRRLGYGTDEMTTHGFRSMASTQLNELGFAPDVIELQLAHAEKDDTRAAYNRATRIAERGKMMQAWADYLDKLRAGKKAEPVRGQSSAA
jgi:integrase